MSVSQPADPENRSLGLDYVLFELVQSIRRHGLIVEGLNSETGTLRVRLGTEDDNKDDKPAEKGMTRSW